MERHLHTLSPDSIDELRGMLRIGVQWDVDATDGTVEPRPRASHVFCSALPVAYSPIPPRRWKTFATLVLEAAYEATMWSAVLNTRSNGTNVALLTRLGGGAFANDNDWIDAAMNRTLQTVSGFELGVRLVSHGVASLVNFAETRPQQAATTWPECLPRERFSPPTQTCQPRCSKAAGR